ncbi:class I SAM-dependent RNA methyltransferase [Corynebacterium hindlerae]|uniref:Class I SAM-dependent RNA methyltransferase n=1 Tax=Corynebacterium hindlerae TaxID=699041 RepID=A0A7G5FFQ2_9CORY|nr:TRAM domain-containing protein [Corynebacterium hindlerae]QMV85443.1 class I SAM-dependent RNA methyltransferase [Corynebacterium hindlerae]
MTGLTVGEELTLTITAPAHGGEGIARHEGGVVFVRGGLPGDTVTARLYDAKKKFARATITDVVHPASGRVSHRCPAAAQGAGCCDYSTASPELERSLKEEVLRDQLRRIGKLTDLPDIDYVDLAPADGWRTRLRLGVDSQGRAGFRKPQSTDIVVGAQCVQAPEGVLDDILAPDARFTPGAELVVAVDSDGQRAVLETKRAARGRSVSRVIRHVSGPKKLTQRVADTEFRLDPLGFWQAHVAAPEAYTDTVTDWLEPLALSEPTVWDLYGGVGLFVPAILRALAGAHVISVELGPAAARTGSKALAGKAVEFVTGDVGRVVDKLPAPDVVVLDPPRKGAGADVAAAIAAREPAAIVHVGCDPATFARDVAAWNQQGYQLKRLRLFNAFPGTHHSETFGFLTRI